MSCDSRTRARLACVISFALVLLCAADSQSQDPTASGLNDVVVFDPGAHERGLPAVRMDRDKGQWTVDIPPAVHVHRYYYSGEKVIQGPIVSGGPTVVVANHPKTGQKMYMDVVLPAGAPRIAYKKHSITYIYPGQRVEVKFQSWPFDTDKAVVKHHHGKGFHQTISDAHRHVKRHVGNHLKKSPVVQSLVTAGENIDKLVMGAGSGIGSLTKQGVNGIDSLISVVPGVSYLRGLADQRGETQRNAEIQEADRLNQRNATQFLPTNR